MREIKRFADNISDDAIKKRRKGNIDDDDCDDYLSDEDLEQKKIIKNVKGYEYIFNIDEDILSPNAYRGFFDILDKATDKDTIILNINSPGGYVCTTVQFFDKLLNTKAYTIANVYMAYSAASCICFCCSEINVKKFGSIMIHSMSSGTYGKISDIQDYAEFTAKQDVHMNAEIYAGFLTKEEMKAINKGKELWLNKEECDRRLKNWKSIKQRLLSK